MMAIARHPWQDDTEDDLADSFFQQQPYQDQPYQLQGVQGGAPADPFASDTFFESGGTGAMPRSTPGDPFSPLGSSSDFFDQPTAAPRRTAPRSATGTSTSQPSAAEEFDYGGLMDKIGRTPDPRQKLVLKDQLARQLAQNFKAAGSEVTWEGDELIVDGRRYVVGDGALAGGKTPPQADTGLWHGYEQNPKQDPLGKRLYSDLANEAGAAAAGAAPATPGMTNWNDPLSPITTGYMESPTPLRGFNTDRALAGGDTRSVKDSFARAVSRAGVNMAGLTKEQVGAELAAKVVPELLREGIPVLDVQGDKILIGAYETGGRAEWVDVVQNAGGSDVAFQWLPDSETGAAGPTTGPGLLDATGALAPGTAGAAGVQVNAGNEGQYGVPSDPAARDQFYAGLNQGAPVAGQPGLVWMHDGSGWTVGPAGGATAGTPGAPASPRPAWMESAPYVPGEIGTEDLPDTSMESLLASMGPDYAPTPVAGSDYESEDVAPEEFDTYDFEGWRDLPGFEVGDIEGVNEDLLRRILLNPESLGERDIAMMQAANREETAALGLQEQEALTDLGFEYGINDSPFLASERLASRRARDEKVRAGNRAVEIEAAKTNAGDRRAASALGSSYVDAKGRLKLAQRGQVFGEQAEGERNKQTSVASKQARAQYLTGVKTGNADRALESAKVRMQADVANNQNMFNAAKLRQDKVLGVVDADLRRAAETTNRMQLREASKQAAADLGISRDKLMSDWLQALMDDATERYGIDVAADIDREKLAQAGTEFKEDLAFRIMAFEKQLGLDYARLGETGRQFDYGYGLDVARLGEDARQFDTTSFLRSYGV